MIKINSEQFIARDNDTLFLLQLGKNVGYTKLVDKDDKAIGSLTTLGSNKNPVLYLTTQNLNEMVKRSVLPKIKGAVCKEKEIRPWMDEDPYGRRVQRGSYSYEVWDMTEVFKQLPTAELEFAGTEYTSVYRLTGKIR